MTGRIVCLNGTSSAGKTSTARAVQKLLHPEVWLVCGIDTFLSMASRAAFEEHAIHRWNPIPAGGVRCEPMPAGMRLLTGMYHAAAALVRAGNNVVFDDVSLSPELLKQCAEAFAPFDSLFVGVHCSLEVLAERERQRADRTPGAAIGMAAFVHRHAVYDFEIDTSSTSTEDCAEAIVHRLRNGAPGEALRQLHRALPIVSS